MNLKGVDIVVDLNEINFLTIDGMRCNILLNGGPRPILINDIKTCRLLNEKFKTNR